jgi:hypothetical protein
VLPLSRRWQNTVALRQAQGDRRRAIIIVMPSRFDELSVTTEHDDATP